MITDDDIKRAFIAASGTLVPALLDEAERLDNALEVADAVASSIATDRDDAMADAERARDDRDTAIRERDAALSVQRQLECQASALEAELERMNAELATAHHQCDEARADIKRNAESTARVDADIASLLTALGVTTVPAALDEIRKLRETARAAEVLATTMKEAAR
jgi:chromosome segregation ATPase